MNGSPIGLDKSAAKVAAVSDDKPLSSIQRKLSLARLFASIEAGWPAWFPLIAVVTSFVVLALFEAFAKLPLWLHWIVLVGFVGAAVWALWYALRAMRWATERTAIQRLETDSKLDHQPLQASADELPGAIDDPVAKAIWQRHQRMVREKLGGLKLTLPRSMMPKVDPWAMRAALGLVLIVALVEGGREFGPRMANAFVPSEAPVAASAELAVQLWVTPPGYTRTPPLSDEQTARNDVLRVPAGSEALLQLHNAPLIAQSQDLGLQVTLDGAPLEIEALGNASFEAVIDIQQNGVLAVARGEGDIVKDWVLEVASDQPPEIAFIGPPLATSRLGLELAYEATDDYGLAEIDVLFALSEEVEEPDLINLLSPTGAPTTLSTVSFLELTAHPLAGLNVKMWMIAKDQMDQEGRSDAVDVLLPERIFNHPLAKAIIEERKRLAGKPDEADEVVDALEELAGGELAQGFGASVPLGLATAASRIEQGADQYRAVIDLLWEIALFIEDGGLSLAERELRQLQEQLQRALQEGADDEELQQLMDQLQQALDEFLEEMQRQAMEQMQQMSPEDMQNMQPMDPSQMVDRQDLQEMMDQARELMEQGMREEALDMLAQLQEMMENLQAGMQMQPQQGQSEAEQAMEDLQKMIEMQQQLLDRSFEMQNGEGQQQQGLNRGEVQNGQERGQQPGQQPGQQQGQGQGQGQMPSDATGRASMEQNALRRALGELMRRMGEMGMEIPRSLGQAEMQMRGARDALGEGQPGDAIGPQTEAVDQMQQGGQAMMEQLREMMAQMPGQGQMPTRAERPGRDPLGRSMRNDGGFDSDGVEVPPENDLGGARGVLEELHRRARDRQRPAEELDYYDRLLDRF